MYERKYDFKATEVLLINLNSCLFIFRGILYLKFALKWHKDYNGKAAILYVFKKDRLMNLSENNRA